MASTVSLSLFFFFNDTATTEIYTLSLHDALPICVDADPDAADLGLRAVWRAFADPVGRHRELERSAGALDRECEAPARPLLDGLGQLLGRVDRLPRHRPHGVARSDAGALRGRAGGHRSHLRRQQRAHADVPHLLRLPEEIGHGGPPGYQRDDEPRAAALDLELDRA